MKVYKKQRDVILTNTPPLSQYRRKLGNAEKETSLNVFTTWELSFQQLQSQASANEVEAKLLTLFAFLDNKDISEQLLAEFHADTKEESKTAKLLTWLDGFTNAKGQWDSDSFADVLITLRDLSLLQGFSQELDGFYHSSLHPLIKDWSSITIVVHEPPQHQCSSHIRLSTARTAQSSGMSAADTMTGMVEIVSSSGREASTS